MHMALGIAAALQTPISQRVVFQRSQHCVCVHLSRSGCSACSYHPCTKRANNVQAACCCGCQPNVTVTLAAHTKHNPMSSQRLSLSSQHQLLTTAHLPARTTSRPGSSRRHCAVDGETHPQNASSPPHVAVLRPLRRRVVVPKLLLERLLALPLNHRCRHWRPEVPAPDPAQCKSSTT